MNFVKIPGKDFEIQTTPVTQKEWEDIMNNNPSYFKGDTVPNTLPVENVSFDDVQVFIYKLNICKPGYVYRLPTEEEWVSCFGKDLDTDDQVLNQAWCSENSNGMPHPVATKAPNEFGLYDMRGNVWEWTSTSYPDYSSSRVVRGGGWHPFARHARSAGRYGSAPGLRFFALGFRLVRTTSLPSSPVTLDGSENREAVFEAALNRMEECMKSYNLSVVDVIKTLKEYSKQMNDYYSKCRSKKKKIKKVKKSKRSKKK